MVESFLFRSILGALKTDPGRVGSWAVGMLCALWGAAIAAFGQTIETRREEAR